MEAGGQKLRWCSKCVLPDTRPNLRILASGECNACEQHARNEQLDWDSREQAFFVLVEDARKQASAYDCVIPVSGGKDSTWQVSKCLEAGLRPLAVTWRTPGRTQVGEKNLANLRHLGVDHIDVSVNPLVEMEFTLEAFRQKGSSGIPQHLAVFSVPLRLAVTLKIPLVIFGENSAAEYGAVAQKHVAMEATSEWLRTYGVPHGSIADDWYAQDKFREGTLFWYTFPSDDEVQQAGVKAVFLGDYFRWNPQKSLEVAAKVGFSHDQKARVGAWNFADIDCDYISVHHWMKWYKFGFSRTYDNLSVDIRNGRTTRSQAITQLTTEGFATPLGDIRKFCEYVNISTKDFFSIAEKFRNSKIWHFNGSRWTIENHLIPDLDFNLNLQHEGL